MSDRPLIAFFANVAPYPTPLYGAQIRVERLIRELLRDFDVALVCESGVSEDELRSGWELASSLARIVAAPRRQLPQARSPEWGSVASSVRGALRGAIPTALPSLHTVVWSDELVTKARRLLIGLPVKAVWASRSWMAEMARSAGASPIHIDVDDFEGPLILKRLANDPFYLRKPLHWMQAAHLQRYERRLSRRFESVSVCKAEDVEHFAPATRARVRVIPNAVDLPERHHSRAPHAYTMLFVGALWYGPNASGLEWFVREVLPRVRDQVPEAVLVVAGHGPVSAELSEALSLPGIELHVSPESLSELYARSALSVAPLLSGGGTSIKVLESLVFGVPIIASPVAARGLGLQSGVHLKLAASAPEFARECVTLLRDPATASRLATTGREEVERRFTWERVGGIAREAMWSMIEGARRTR